jgi:hypothetical protein
MTLSDLVFLGSLLFVAGWCARIVWSILRRRWEKTGRLIRSLGVFLAAYAAILMAVSLVRPRRFYAAGERRCFDDWCVAALDAKPVDGRGDCNWVATVEVSSDAKRICQRALDAHAELEDGQGNRYSPCAPPLAAGPGPVRWLSDELGPGESFRVVLPFRIPGGAPAGLILHHGDLPGIVIIGADQSFLHRPALHRLALPSR